MLKLTAAALILVSSVLAGIYFSSKMRSRISELSAAIDAVETVKQRIIYFLEPLDSILAVLRAENIVFYGCADSDFSDSWKCSFLTRAGALKPYERDKIVAFGANLGKSDKDGQIALCDAMLENLRKQKKEAESDCEKFSRAAAAIPVFCGVTIILLLI